MARRRGDAPTRGEITEKVQQHESDMDEKADEIDDTVCDVETERDTLESLELRGTAEGTEDVGQAIESAEDVSVGEFDEESDQLEQIHDQSQEHQEELDDRSDTASSDRDKIGDATGKIHSDSAGKELNAAKDAAERDIEFLDEQAERSQEAREESRRLHEEQRSRVTAARGA